MARFGFKLEGNKIVQLGQNGNAEPSASTTPKTPKAPAKSKKVNGTPASKKRKVEDEEEQVKDEPEDEVEAREIV